jgi:hypothetical protein
MSKRGWGFIFKREIGSTDAGWGKYIGGADSKERVEDHLKALRSSNPGYEFEFMEYLPPPPTPQKQVRTCTVESHEVTSVLHQAIAGSVSVTRISTASWDDVYCGLVEFDIGGWQLTFYNDCDTLDYCHQAIKIGTDLVGWFDFWFDNGGDPVALLSVSEQESLEQILKAI